MPSVVLRKDGASVQGTLAGDTVSIKVADLISEGFSVEPDEEWEVAPAPPPPLAAQLALAPELVRRLSTRLGASGGFSKEGRIERAWRAGVDFGAVRRGDRAVPADTPGSIPLREKFTVVLSARGNTTPRLFHTIGDFEAYQRACDHTALYHCFASQSECEAFASGAGIEWSAVV